MPCDPGAFLLLDSTTTCTDVLFIKWDCLWKSPSPYSARPNTSAGRQRCIGPCRHVRINHVRLAAICLSKHRCSGDAWHWESGAWREAGWLTLRHTSCGNARRMHTANFRDGGLSGCDPLALARLIRPHVLSVRRQRLPRVFCTPFSIPGSLNLLRGSILSTSNDFTKFRVVVYLWPHYQEKEHKTGRLMGERVFCHLRFDLATQVFVLI